MKLYFLTLFPAMIEQYFQESMMKRAVESGAIQVQAVNIRDFAQNKHNRVDDYPYGGGAGMVMAAPPIIRALHSIPDYSRMPVIFTSPAGKRFDSGESRMLAQNDALVFLCGHYEGVDERAIQACVTAEYSIGDYVLTGGELPALVMADAVARRVPGVLGNRESLSEESFEGGLLEYPQYTRPETVEGMAVPEVLLSGNHGAIRKWREAQALERTRIRRPDLLKENS
jgi:tRNA (guanine37-N1)-methyltransferase